jgi:hypothetical protein
VLHHCYQHSFYGFDALELSMLVGGVILVTLVGAILF